MNQPVFWTCLIFNFEKTLCRFFRKISNSEKFLSSKNFKVQKVPTLNSGWTSLFFEPTRFWILKKHFGNYSEIFFELWLQKFSDFKFFFTSSDFFGVVDMHTDTCSFCSCKFGSSRKSNEIFYEKVFKWNSAFWCLLQKMSYLMQKQSTLSYLMQKQLTPQSHEISMRRPPFWLFQLLHCFCAHSFATLQT